MTTEQACKRSAFQQLCALVDDAVIFSGFLEEYRLRVKTEEISLKLAVTATGWRRQCWTMLEDCYQIKPKDMFLHILWIATTEIHMLNIQF